MGDLCRVRDDGVYGRRGHPSGFQAPSAVWHTRKSAFDVLRIDIIAIQHQPDTVVENGG